MALKLPLDILVDILSVADQATAARLMRTCKYLQKQGERLILRNPCLWFGVSAEGFVRYMLSDLRSRLPLLRGIRLEMRTHSRSSSERLRELFIKLRTSPEFVSLSILHPEWLLYDEVGLSSAIAALAHLKRLELWNVGPNTVGMLHGMCSRLVKVTLSFHNQWPNGGQPDVAQLFRGSQKTLEELEVWLSGPTTSHIYGDHSAAAYAVCYPRMRSLTIVQSPFELHTADYVRVYPNLKHLTIRKPLAYPLREVNLPGPPSDMDAYAPWPRLRSVEGSVKTLYGLALPCNVSTVSINDFDHQDNFDLFRTVLADTQPVHLKLNIHSAKAWQEIYEHALKKMQLPHLRGLSVKIVLTSVDMEMDVKRWLKRVLRVSKKLSLSAFELHLNCSRLASVNSSIHGTSVQGQNDSCTGPLPIQKQLQSLNIHSVVEKAQEKAPQLKRVVVRVSGLYGGQRSSAAVRGERVP